MIMIDTTTGAPAPRWVVIESGIARRPMGTQE
jgi:hypothetical protein